MTAVARFVMRSLFALWLLVLLAFVLAFGDADDLYGDGNG